MSTETALPIVALIYTGGTIGMDGDDDLKPMEKEAFLEQLKRTGRFTCEDNKLFLVFHPAEQKASQVSRIEVVFIGIDKPIDSSLATPREWARVAIEVDRVEDEDTCDGIVVLHGTDTLAWTASALSFLLGDLKVPVVMTGSQLPLAFSRTDALRNLVSAIEFAASKSTPKEVCIFFDQLLLRGNRATKVSAAGFAGFESRNYDPIGVAGTVRTVRDQIGKLPEVKRVALDKWRKNLKNVCVIVLRVYPGMNVFPQLPSKPSALGIVLEAYGSGTADEYHGLRTFLKGAKKRGAYIVLRTQVPHGEVKAGVYGAAGWLTKLRVILGSDITSEACAAKLYYLLAQGLDATTIKRALESCLRGEANLPVRGFVDGVLRDMPAVGLPAVDAGQKRYLREGEKLESELIAQLESYLPGQVTIEPPLGDTRIDILVTVNGKTIGFECSATVLDRSRAETFLRRLQKSGVDRMVVVAHGFLRGAETAITTAGGKALTWPEAIKTDWMSFH